MDRDEEIKRREGEEERGKGEGGGRWRRRVDRRRGWISRGRGKERAGLKKYL
jgi:hypothetical protein